MSDTERLWKERSENMVDYQEQNSSLITAKDQTLIDNLIAELVVQQNQCNQEMEKQILEFSTALSAGNTRSSALQSQGFFKHFLGRISGKNEKSMQVIQQNQNAAVYAMGKFIQEMLKSSRLNWRIQYKLNTVLQRDIDTLNQDQAVLSGEMLKVKQMLVAMYDSISALEKAQYYCRRCSAKLDADQYLCPRCHTLQPIKIQKLPKPVAEKIQSIGEAMNLNSEQLNPDIVWNPKAKEYADSLVRAREIAIASGALSRTEPLCRKVSNAIEECRQAEFQIAVIGTVKAGKSSLLNAILGEELAPVGVNSLTAALTEFHASTEGNFVEVSFYSQEQWDKMLREDSRTKGTPVSGTSCDENTASRWIDHQPVRTCFQTVSKMKQEIKRWVAADSQEHLFVRKVEVGIDHHHFQLPKEIVFVDTPGLHDLAVYRSEVTRQYIMRADAVLLALPIKALDQQDLETISLVLDQAGKNRKNVFIIGTQKDRVKKAELEQYLYGAEGWCPRLIEVGCYQNEAEFKSHLFAVSARDHWDLEKIMRMSHEERCKYATEYDEDYMDLEKHVELALPREMRKEFDLAHISSRDDVCYRMAAQSFGVRQLMKYLQENLVAHSSEMRIAELHEKTALCHKELAEKIRKEIRAQRAICDKVSAGDQAINEELNALELEKREAKARYDKIQADLEMLR